MVVLSTSSLIIGAISVNALAIPVARSPAPELEREPPRLFSTVSYHDLTSVLFNSFATMEQGTRDPGFPPAGTLGPVRGWAKQRRRKGRAKWPRQQVPITSAKRGRNSCAGQRYRGRGKAWVKPL